MQLCLIGSLELAARKAVLSSLRFFSLTFNVTLLWQEVLAIQKMANLNFRSPP